MPSIQNYTRFSDLSQDAQLLLLACKSGNLDLVSSVFDNHPHLKLERTYLNGVSLYFIALGLSFEAKGYRIRGDSLPQFRFHIDSWADLEPKDKDLARTSSDQTPDLQPLVDRFLNCFGNPWNQPPVLPDLAMSLDDSSFLRFANLLKRGSETSFFYEGGSARQLIPVCERMSIPWQVLSSINKMDYAATFSFFDLFGQKILKFPEAKSTLESWYAQYHYHPAAQAVGHSFEQTQIYLQDHHIDPNMTVVSSYSLSPSDRFEASQIFAKDEGGDLTSERLSSQYGEFRDFIRQARERCLKNPVTQSLVLGVKESRFAEALFEKGLDASSVVDQGKSVNLYFYWKGAFGVKNQRHRVSSAHALAFDKVSSFHQLLHRYWNNPDSLIDSFSNHGGGDRLVDLQAALDKYGSDTPFKARQIITPDQPHLTPYTAFLSLASRNSHTASKFLLTQLKDRLHESAPDGLNWAIHTLKHVRPVTLKNGRREMGSYVGLFDVIKKSAYGKFVFQKALYPDDSRQPSAPEVIDSSVLTPLFTVIKGLCNPRDPALALRCHSNQRDVFFDFSPAVYEYQNGAPNDFDPFLNLLKFKTEVWHQPVPSEGGTLMDCLLDGYIQSFDPENYDLIMGSTEHVLQNGSHVSSLYSCLTPLFGAEIQRVFHLGFSDFHDPQSTAFGPLINDEPLTHRKLRYFRSSHPPEQILNSFLNHAHGDAFVNLKPSSRDALLNFMITRPYANSPLRASQPHEATYQWTLMITALLSHGAQVKTPDGVLSQFLDCVAHPMIKSHLQGAFLNRAACLQYTDGGSSTIQPMGENPVTDSTSEHLGLPRVRKPVPRTL